MSVTRPIAESLRVRLDVHTEVRGVPVMTRPGPPEIGHLLPSKCTISLKKEDVVRGPRPCDELAPCFQQEPDGTEHRDIGREDGQEVC